MENKKPYNSAFNKWPLDKIKLLFNISIWIRKNIIVKHGLRATLSLSIFICLSGKLSFIFEDSTDGDVATRECIWNRCVKDMEDTYKDTGIWTVCLHASDILRGPNTTWKCHS